MPAEFFSATELVLGEDGVLVKQERPAGSNNVGMVGWHCFMKTPEYPEGREMVIVGNDCTFMSGSFGVKEDDVYDAISKYARNLGLPRVYIASNSGARIGLVEELKPYFKVAWNDDSNPGMGFKYLYLTKEDYKAFPEGTVAAEEVVDAGETRMKLTDIIGQIHGIGVENLRGSGMIAGEQSAAYADAFTLSYISGRSVGIGAYLCRLGQRNIQMTNGPLILTGYLALNKLLGREVYTSQDQLGGPQVMMPNGVSHLQVDDDQQGARAILKWLSYTPATAFTRSRAAPVCLTRSTVTLSSCRRRRRTIRAICSQVSTWMVLSPRVSLIPTRGPRRCRTGVSLLLRVAPVSAVSHAVSSPSRRA